MNITSLEIAQATMDMFFCLLRGFPKGAAPHLAHDFAEQSVVCYYTLCRRCPENTVAAG